LIAGYCFGVQRNLRLTRGLPFAAFLLILSSLVLSALCGCGGSTKPVVASITFTSDSAGAKPICTTAITSNTPANTPVCSAAQLSSFAVNGPATYLYANVIGDDQDLGVSWTVTCGSATSAGSGAIDTACGTFNPAQTLSGPVPLYPITGIVTAYTTPSAIPKGGTVTIAAHATSLPSVSSSVTLTIVAAQASLAPSAPGRFAVEAQAARLAEASSPNRVKPRT